MSGDTASGSEAPSGCLREAGRGDIRGGLLRGDYHKGDLTLHAILLRMGNVILAAVLLGVCQVIGFAGFCFVLRWYLSKRISAAQARINAELTALVDSKPCQSASVLNAVGRIVGQEAGRTAKASFMADLSHAKRAANIAGEEAIVEAVGDKQPVLGAVLSGMGRNKRKGLFDNPLVQGLLSQFIGNAPPSGNHEDNHKGGSSFTL